MSFYCSSRTIISSMLTERRAKLPMMTRQAMIMVTDAKDMNPCVKMLLNPSFMRYPILLSFIAVIPVHSVADYVARIERDNAL